MLRQVIDRLMKVSVNFTILQARVEDKCLNSCHQSNGSNLNAYYSCALLQFPKKAPLMKLSDWGKAPL